MSKEHQYSIYYAGHLFDFKHLIGNYALAEAIAEQSCGTYRCILPQDLEQTDSRSVAIRDSDLKALVESDLALFHFDGTDVDSGTVVEFILAKMLNIPSVIVRTDFRSAGDQGKDGDSWNLMMSGYPHTSTIELHSMKLYQEKGSTGMTSAIAAEVVFKFDWLLGQLEESYKTNVPFTGIPENYRLVLDRCGKSLSEQFSDADLSNLILSKILRHSIPNDLT